MASGFSAIQPAALRRNVLDLLRAALLDGRYQAGEELSDSRLAVEFGVSRGPVREALLQLAEEGLVVHRHNRGFAVPRFGQSDLDQINAVRHPLETLALEEARRHANPEALENLATLKQQLLDTFHQGGPRACARADFTFHQAIWRLAGNPWLETTLSRISMPFFAYVSAFGLSRRDHSADLMERMHANYIACVSGSSSDSAADCVAFHLGLVEKDQDARK